MSCISRRAFADRYAFKLYKEENGEIKERNYIWMEYKCPNEVLQGNDHCVECVKKDKNLIKYQSNTKFDHGTVDGPYTPQSKLYGSAYYLKFIKEGWKIKEEDERRAKEAQQKASMPPRKAKVDESGNPLTVSTPNTATPKAATPKVATSKIPTPKAGTPKATKPSTPNVASSSGSTVSDESPKKPRKIRVTKKPALPPANLVPGHFVESLEAPLHVSDVVIVKVKKIRCEGSEYYYDSASGKLYGVSVKGVGTYKGRYNSQDETIHTEFPDSDDE